MPCSCGAGAATRVTDANAVLDMDQIIISENSKREYLLAQIRQKDAIIESLLKQVCVCFYPTFSSLPSPFFYLVVCSRCCTLFLFSVYDRALVWGFAV